ncbi:MAG: hypothetical protein H8E55_03290, partial [Pelagibacterales bacterium]|nr:hypothetical protein [Pelagibacterales bacterium]
DDLSNKKLINYLDLYNLGCIIAKSENSKKNLYKRYKKIFFIKFIKIDDFQIYKTNITLGFIIGGTGDIELDFNKIKIKNLEIKNKDIILKYHWHPTLKEKSGLKLEPVYILDMPIPFIKILNVSDSKLEIYNSYNE